MNQHPFKKSIGTLICWSLFGGALLYMMLPLLLGRGSSFDVRAQQEWILQAVKELEQRPPPTLAAGQSGEACWWTNRGYLLFSNGWAAYKVHTVHDDGREGDVAVLRTSDGAYYLTHIHFCTGITEQMFPQPDWEEPGPRPADARDFLQHLGRLQGWNLFAPDQHLWCAVNASGESSLSTSRKPLWVWISSGEGTNRATCFERRYKIQGAYVSWTTHWLSNEVVEVNFYDYGPQNSPRLNPENLRSNYLMGRRFERDRRTGQFTDSGG